MAEGGAPVRAALVQLCSGDDPAANLVATEALVRQAAAGGATLVLTPECTNIVSASRTLQARELVPEGADPTLARLSAAAKELGIWLLIGSLCLKGDAADGRYVNRSFLIGPDGAIRARYDKIHMFDVDVGGAESYRESAAFQPGGRAVVAEAAGLRLGMTVCYDLRFPHLYRDLAKAGAVAITVPSAFTVPTGSAHWHVLLRARAIETGAFVLAPAQSGSQRPQPRRRSLGRGARRRRRRGRRHLRRDRPGAVRRRARAHPFARPRPRLRRAGLTGTGANRLPCTGHRR
jgi:predicted amidohydrolase